MSRHDTWASYLDPEGTLDDAPPEAERAALDRIRGVLADPATWSEPPDDLTTRVLALAAFDSTDEPPADTHAEPVATAADAAPGAAPDAAPDAAPAGSPHVIGSALTGPGADEAATGGTDAEATPARPEGETAPVVPLASRRRRRWMVAAASGIAAAVAAVLAISLWPGSSPTRYPVAGTAIEPAATATVTVDPRPAGVAITVQIKGLPPSTDDTYYAVWLRGASGTVPVGSFHWRKGGEPIDLWSGVEPSRYPTFFITRQHEGAPPTPSTETVLQGALT